MNKINFQNGTLISKAKVTINGTVYEVEPEEYEGTTPLNAENLNQMQKNAEDAIDEVGEALEETNQNIEKLTTYSTTEEIKTGEVWIDGKPIYRKTYTFALPISSNKRYDLNITELNIDTGLFDFNDSYYYDKTNKRVYPIVVTNVASSSGGSPASANNQAGVYYSESRHHLFAEGGYNSNWDMTITIRYTKTTD